MGCELAQGFHFHKALTPGRLAQLLALDEEMAEQARLAAA
jgi:hypothetical protein